MIEAQSIAIDSQDVIRLMLQFLKENHLQQAMNALQLESGIVLNIVDDNEKFLSDIRYGRWDTVLAQTAGLQLPVGKLSALYEQVLLELIEAGERDLAREILHTAEPLLVFKIDFPERYLRLETFCKRPFFSASDVYDMGQSKESKRQELAESLACELSTVEPSRLLSLLTQALRFQQSTSLLPQGGYDLFRGAKKNAKRDAEDKIIRTPQSGLGLQATSKQAKLETIFFSPDGNNCVLGYSNGTLEVRSVEVEGIVLRQDLAYQTGGKRLEQASSVLCGVFSKDGDHFAIGAEDGQISLYRLSTGHKLRNFSHAHTAGVLSLVFARDGSQLLSGSFDGTARIHGLKSGKTLKDFRGHTAYVCSAVYTKDSVANVLTASADGAVKLWDSRTAECLLTCRSAPYCSTVAASCCQVPAFSWHRFPVDRRG
jgi:WD40 repeat-containing protein SMU1